MHSREVRVQVASGRDDSRDEQEVHDGDKHVKVEEHDDLLATDGSVFGPDVVDHDGGHNQGNKVDDQGGGLEDESVGQTDVSGVANGLNAIGLTNKRTQGQRDGGADVVEVAKGKLVIWRRHVNSLWNMWEGVVALWLSFLRCKSMN